jgi:plastocyanin
VIGLREQSTSGYAGIASLAATDDGGTTVTVFLARNLGESGATPAPSANAATVQILDFAFEPAVVEVKVGTTVTWVNDGPTAHTSTAYGEGGKKVWDSAILPQGGTYSYTFDEPGAFDYLCTLHPSMKAHIDIVP